MFRKKFSFTLLFLVISFLTIAQDTARTLIPATNAYLTGPVGRKYSVRISFYGGGAYLFAPLKSIVSFDYSGYINKLKTGVIYGAEITVIPKNVIGIGLKYVIFLDNYALPVLHDEDNISTTFIGPVVSIFSPTPFRRLNFIGSFSLGYLVNSNSGSQSGAPWNADGRSIGGSASAGFELKIGISIAIGIDLQLIGGNIRSYSINGSTVNLTKPDNLLRMDLTGGLRFYF